MPVACAGSLQLAAIRASRLEDDGSLIQPNPDGSAFSTRPVSLGLSPTTITGESIEQRDGIGNICLSLQNPDLTTGLELTLTLCQLDPELLELLTGGQIVADGGGNFGYISPSGETAPPPVEFHAWSKAWAGTGQVSAPFSYIHWVFPFTQWTIGSQTLENGALTLEVTANVRPNGSLGNGSFNDLPNSNFGDGYLGFFYTDLTDVPNADDAPYDANGFLCGYVDTPAGT